MSHKLRDCWFDDEKVCKWLGYTSKNKKGEIKIKKGNFIRELKK